MNLLKLTRRSLVFAALLPLSLHAESSQEGGLVELWNQHDTLAGEVAALTEQVDTSAGELLATRALLDETRIQLTATGVDLTEAAQLLTVIDANLTRVETSTLRSFIPAFESFRADHSKLISDPVLFSASPLRQGEIVAINSAAAMEILLQAADVWDSLQSNEVLSYLTLNDDWQQASDDFRLALAEIQTALDEGLPVQIWEELIKARAVYPHGDIMASFYYIFRESIELSNEDKQYFLEHLRELNDISEAISDYLESLNQFSGLVRDCLVAQWVEHPDP